MSFTALKRSPTSRAEQQLNFLNERMNEYKQAALKAKKNRDIELAKKYLRIAKVVFYSLSNDNLIYQCLMIELNDICRIFWFFL